VRSGGCIRFSHKEKEAANVNEKEGEASEVSFDTFWEEMPARNLASS
jgi:hypothetical protein